MLNYVPCYDNVWGDEFWIHTLTSAHEGLNYVCIQVPVLSALFFVLFLGNTVTTSMVIPQKLQEQVRFNYQLVGLERLSWGGSKHQSDPTQVSDTWTIWISWQNFMKLGMNIMLLESILPLYIRILFAHSTNSSHEYS
jgi:hypothetical protein